MIESILKTYGISEVNGVEPLTSGLINRTWKITCGDKQYILQRINDNVFKNPHQLGDNIRMIGNYLAEHFPDYLFAAPIDNLDDEGIIHVKDEGYFRLFPFVKNSHTISVVDSPQQAFEAALQFGKFTRLLSGFDSTRLHTTIPDFHNLSLRYKQFEESIKNGNKMRVRQSAQYIGEIRNQVDILVSFEKIQKSHQVKKRVTHHDTKISNVLFDDTGAGICVIDLDTVMPGYFISDVGDMMRTYLSPASEEEKDFSKIHVRDDIFRAIVQGYLSNMNDELTGEERELIFYSGQFLIYMQAIRFLADYCNNDSYYGANYEEHNFVRAGNQLALLRRLEEKRSKLTEIISAESKTYSKD
jgi:Ser/Thr protein kinase RdoA (MazF antagonist)